MENEIWLHAEPPRQLVLRAVMSQRRATKTDACLMLDTSPPDGSFVPAPRIRGYKDHGGLFGGYQWGYPRAQAQQYLR